MNKPVVGELYCPKCRSDVLKRVRMEHPIVREPKHKERCKGWTEDDIRALRWYRIQLRNAGIDPDDPSRWDDGDDL